MWGWALGNFFQVPGPTHTPRIGGTWIFFFSENFRSASVEDPRVSFLGIYKGVSVQRECAVSEGERPVRVTANAFQSSRDGAFVGVGRSVGRSVGRMVGLGTGRSHGVGR